MNKEKKNFYYVYGIFFRNLFINVILSNVYNVCVDENFSIRLL